MVLFFYHAKLEIILYKFLVGAVNFLQTITTITRQGWVVLLRGRLNISLGYLNISLALLFSLYFSRIFEYISYFIEGLFDYFSGVIEGLNILLGYLSV